MSRVSGGYSSPSRLHSNSFFTLILLDSKKARLPLLPADARLRSSRPLRSVASVGGGGALGLCACGQPSL